MWASKVYLRWYKSFNIRFHGYLEADGAIKKWDQYKEEDFPFVEIPLDRRISTVVGANESGKSHLLAAVEKALRGWSTTTDGKEEYEIQHVCRYCALDGLEHEVWPHLGLDFNFASKSEYDHCLTALNLTPSTQPVTDGDRVLRFFVDGGAQSGYVTVYDHANNLMGRKSEAEWKAVCEDQLPSVHFIDSKLALSNEVHVQQLLNMYDKSPPGVAYDPLALQGLADSILGITFTADQPVPQAKITEVEELRTALQERTLGPTESVKLEALLFDEILGIKRPVLERMKRLGDSNRGYVERLVAEINHRLEEALDISQFWQQDDNFSLQVEYKGGFFYFLISDKTGAKYTFNERSSGLRYFLSYYIQAKAIKQSLGKKHAIVLMDEPDSFLSATAQKNLLQVFESIVEPVTPITEAEADAPVVATVPLSVQLVYTTHSPFLINRNFPNRIALMRKGDGSEGTQLVEQTSTRRYEPVRSGLGIDCAETLFMGAMNVVLEGISDQKVLVAAIQTFGSKTNIDDLLDLNRVTFISADGVSNVPQLVKRSTTGSEKRPVVVVMVDGDVPGMRVADEIDAKKILDKEFVATLDQLVMPTSWHASPKELEDIIPPVTLAVCIQRYLKSRWNEDADVAAIAAGIGDITHGDTTAKRVISLTKSLAGTDADDLTNNEIKGGIYDAFVDCMQNGKDFKADVDRSTALDEFERVIRSLCQSLRLMLDKAETRARRDRLHKHVRLAIERYEKAHRDAATKADVERCLRRIGDDCTGSEAHARQARDNAFDLQQKLDEEVDNAGEPVDAEVWIKRLRLLWDCPWKKLQLE